VTMQACLSQSLRCWALALLFAATSAMAFAQPSTTTKSDDKSKTDEKSKEGTATSLQKAAKAFTEGKFDDAATKYLQEACTADPKLGTPRVVLSRWLFEARKGPEARSMLEQALAENTRHPECYLLNASYALNEGRLTDAILSLDQAAQYGRDLGWLPDDRKHFTDQALSGLAMAYERRNDWNQVQRYLSEFDRNNPGNPQILLRLARSNLFLNRIEEATKNLETAFAKDPKLDPPELVMAQFWVNRGDEKKSKEEAEERFKAAKAKYNVAEATGKSPEQRELAAKVYRAYAEWKLAEGNMAEAKKNLEDVEKLEPSSRETHGLQGLILRYEGKHAEAAKQFEQALVKSPSYAYAMANLALSLCESADPKDRARAKEYAEQYQKQNDKNPDGFAVLGYALLKQNDPKLLDEADRALGTVIQSGAIPPDTAYYVAVLLNKRERYEQAADLLEKTLKQSNAFVYRGDAQKLLDEVKPKVKKKDADPAPKK